MAISKDNTIFIYNENNADSLDLALQYLSIHNLDLDHLIPINCSDDEILSDYSTFQSEVENPILNALSNLDEIYVIVLGYKVPGGFSLNGNIISSTSRLSRIRHPLSMKFRNPLFDRKIFKRYNESISSGETLDSDKALIVSRLDGPNKEFVENIIYNSNIIYNTIKVNGRFYFDPYSDRAGTLANQYLNELLDFEDLTLPTLDLESCITTFIDPYVDSVHHQLINDSFYWGWFTDRGSKDFFRNTNSARVFFYNADYDGAFTVRDSVNIDTWPQLSLNNGYISTSGSMSNPVVDGFLRPNPFFIALREGATIGEAMLYSTPYLDWTISNFGDPLIEIAFPATYVKETLDNFIQTGLDREELNEILFEDISRLLAYRNNRLNNQNNILNTVALSTDIPTEVDLLVKSNQMVQEKDFYDSTTNDFIRNLSNYLVLSVIPNYREDHGLNKSNMSEISDYLEDTGIKISELLANEFNIENSNLIYDEGYWSIEVQINEESNNFELQISNKNDFSNILLNIDSSVDETNWFFEERENIFSPLEEDGISSNFVGRRIKYISLSSQHLTRETIYYFRIRQKSDITYDWREFEDIIWT